MSRSIISSALASGAGVCLLFATMAVAQSPQQVINNLKTSNQASGMDKEFMPKAMQVNMAEVSLAHLALQKSSNEEVKEFAERMIHDHTMLEQQMQPVAGQIGVSVPQQVSEQDKMAKDKLEGLSGKQFDEQYIKDMVNGHEQAEKMTQEEASSGQDQSVREVALEANAVIHQHLELAKAVANSEHVTVQ